jgi:Toprim domain-containing protein
MSAAARIAEVLADSKVKARNGNYLVPCPAHDDDTPSLSLRDGERGVMVHCFAGCRSADVYRAIRRRDRKLLEPGDTAPKPVKGASEYERRQHDKAAWLWSRRRPLAGSIAERYLREVRHYTGPQPPTLAFLPAWREHRPAMIAAVTNLVDEPEPGMLGNPRDVECVHLTLLLDDGSGKAEPTRRYPNKKLIASPLIRDPQTNKVIASQPIVLAPPNDLLGLCICEGIEDALSVHVATGLGALAGISADFMGDLGPMLPHHVETVTIYAHSDEAGERGARKLAAALRKRQIEVRIEGIG